MEESPTWVFLRKGRLELSKLHWRASQMAQQVMNLPANEGDIRDVRSIPGSGSPLEEKWQPTPAFLPREFHGQRSLAGYSPWGHRVEHD